MTTIVYDGKVLATDSRACIGNTITDDKRKKLYRNVGIFQAIAFCGSSSYAYFVIDEILKPCKAVADLRDINLSNEADFVLVDEWERVFYFARDECAGGIVVDQVKQPWSWGSGSHFAIAALDFGRTAIEAVKYASTRDVKTNSRIQKYVIKETS